MQKRHSFYHIILFACLLLLSQLCQAGNIQRSKSVPLLAGAADSHLTFHNDSNHQINFRYADKQRGLKPFIVPSALIATGTLLHFSDAKYRLNDWRSEHFNYQGSLDDYLRLGPVAAVYALNAFGVKGKNNLGNQTALLLKTMVLTSVVTKGLKNLTAVERPGGDAGSMPSGHTSIAFAAAQWMHREYGERSTWYSVGAYACATTVGVMRVAKGSHWASDVLVGAGLGMLTTEFIYLTHQYKWDREHLRNFDIFPFQLGQQKGLSLVYHF